jgi:hypothetical protein
METENVHGMIPVELELSQLRIALQDRGRRGGFNLGGVFHFRQLNSLGEVVDEWDAPNVVTNEGLDYLLDVALSGGTAITTWYMGLKDNTGDPVDGTETYATPVFSELTTQYSETVRETWIEGGVSSQSIDNSTTPAEFSIVTTVIVYGALLVGGGTAPSTKGDTAGGGKLFCVANFASSKSLGNGDTLQVTYTISAADDGA